MTTEFNKRVLRDETIAPAGHFAAEIRKGQVLQIIDVEGQRRGFGNSQYLEIWLRSSRS